MKITIESSYGNYSAEIKDEDLQLPVVLGGLILPTLLAMGFANGSLEKYLPLDDLTSELVDYTIRQEARNGTK